MRNVLYRFTGFLSHPYTVVLSVTCAGLVATTAVGSVVVLLS